MGFGITGLCHQIVVGLFGAVTHFIAAKVIGVIGFGLFNHAVKQIVVVTAGVMSINSVVNVGDITELIVTVTQALNTTNSLLINTVADLSAEWYCH